DPAWIRRRQAGVAPTLGYRAEQVGGGGEVEGAYRTRLGLKAGLERIPSALGRGIKRDIADRPEERRNGILGGLMRRAVTPDRLADRLPVGLVVEILTRHPDDARIRRHLPVDEAHEKSRHQLAVAEVTGAAENDEIEWRDGDGTACHGQTTFRRRPARAAGRPGAADRARADCR